MAQRFRLIFLVSFESLGVHNLQTPPRVRACGPADPGPMGHVPEDLAAGTGPSGHVPQAIPAPGFRPLVAGRPAMGKSALALQMAADIAKQGIPVGYISLEMPAKDLATRFLARAARVDQGKLLLGKVTPDEVAKVERVKGAGSIPLAVSAPIDSTFAGVLAQMTSLRRRHGAQVVVIDYLGLVSEASGRNESRQDVIARMSRALKQYALRHEAVVIVVSQLNRALAGRADKRPQMTDLRESGSLEQDSDIIIMVHRPDVYDPEDRVGEAELIVEKSRLGTTGIADVVFQGAYGAFVPMARTPEPQRSAAGYGGVRDGAW